MIYDWLKGVLFFCLAAILVSCELPHTPMLEVEEDVQHDVQKTFTTKSGIKIFIDEEHPVGMSLSDIAIRTEGLEYELNDSINDVDPINEIFLTDLDSNGFDEIYIITQSVGSGSYGNVIAYASNKDKSMTPIYMANAQKLHDLYSGHDRFSIENYRLIREFSIYEQDDTLTVSYRLIPGEASWQLEVTN
jgi:hypothetical protein